MIAYVEQTNQTIEGKTLKDIRSELIRRMKVIDARGLTAKCETGAVVHVEMYDGQDYIKDASGRLIYTNK